ncbi:MAG: hypothetical protein PWP66_384, partial [Thermosediminibacterales bacterium]|nr:hypothetical protein [Thermosediminibacterales bacterium]
STSWFWFFCPILFIPGGFFVGNYHFTLLQECLNNNFEDLDYVYREINNNISRIIKRENFKIELEGVENKKLKDAYYLLHFSLYENIEKGNFTQMYKDLVEISTEMNINEYKITIDNENIYLQLRDNDNSLYRVINRKQREIYTK